MSLQLDRINLFWRAPSLITTNSNRHKRNDVMSGKFSPRKAKEDRRIGKKTTEIHRRRFQI